VNFPAVYGFCLPNAVEQRIIHHHFTLDWQKQLTSNESMHDD
jgi:hypothetical protein